MIVRAVLICVLTLAMIGTANAGVWRVEQEGSGDFTEIQPAVDAAASGDTILIGPGRYDDLTWYDELGGSNVAYWDDGRSLTFIGSAASDVLIGPVVYAPVGTGPAGITNNNDIVLRIENVTFTNLKLGVSSYFGEVYVGYSQFEDGETGLFIGDPVRLEVLGCSFSNMSDYSTAIFRAQHAEIVDCDLEHAEIYFGSSDTGIVRNCEVTGGDFVSFYLSRGTVENCTVRCDDDHPCIYVSDSDTVRFYDNVIEGGRTNLTAGGLNVNVFAERNSFSDPALRNFSFFDNANVFAHDNHIQRAFDFIQEYILVTDNYSHSYERTIDMSNNYWFADGNLGRLDDLIYDGNDNHTLNIFVDYDPIRTEPVPNEPTSLGSFKSLYR